MSNFAWLRSSIAGHLSHWIDLTGTFLRKQVTDTSDEESDFYPVIKRIFVKLDDDPTEGDRSSVYRSARETLGRQLLETGASKEFFERQIGSLQATIDAVELEYCDPGRPKAKTRPLDPRQPYRINSDARVAFIKQQFAALQASLKTEQAEATRTVNIIIREAMREVVRRIALHPEEMGEAEWCDLERVMREIFDGLGYGTKLTRSSKDGGFDLELEAVGFVYLVEVKHWSEPKKVGQDTVDSFIDVVVSNAGKGGCCFRPPASQVR